MLVEKLITFIFFFFFWVLLEQKRKTTMYLKPVDSKYTGNIQTNTVFLRQIDSYSYNYHSICLSFFPQLLLMEP